MFFSSYKVLWNFVLKALFIRPDIDKRVFRFSTRQKLGGSPCQYKQSLHVRRLGAPSTILKKFSRYHVFSRFRLSNPHFADTKLSTSRNIIHPGNPKCGILNRIHICIFDESYIDRFGHFHWEMRNLIFYYLLSRTCCRSLRTTNQR